LFLDRICTCEPAFKFMAIFTYKRKFFHLFLLTQFPDSKILASSRQQ
jgi:hypothetical protein